MQAVPFWHPSLHRSIQPGSHRLVTGGQPISGRSNSELARLASRPTRAGRNVPYRFVRDIIEELGDIILYYNLSQLTNIDLRD